MVVAASRMIRTGREASCSPSGISCRDAEPRRGRILAPAWIVLLGVFSSLILGVTSCGFRRSIPAEDRRAILDDALRQALVERRIPDYALLRDPTHIVISSDLVDPADLPSLPGIRLEALSDPQIHARANEIGDFLHLRFSRFQVVRSGRVRVRLDNVWEQADSSRALYLSGGGLILDYRMRAGRWVGKINGTWIS